MVLSAQAARAWKLASYFFTTTSGIYLVLYVDYSMPKHMQGEKHVFTDIQQAYQGWVNKWIWNIPETHQQRAIAAQRIRPAPQPQPQPQLTASTTTGRQLEDTE